MRIYLILFFSFFILNNAIAQIPDSVAQKPFVHIYLENGHHKKGYLLLDNENEIKIWSEEIGIFRVGKDVVRKIEYLEKSDKPKKGNESEDYTQFNILSNSAYLPKKGEMFVRTPYFLSACYDIGLTHRFTFGVDVFALVAMNANLRYSFDFSEISKISFSSGFYYIYLNGGLNAETAVWSNRAVVSIGSAERNFSLGAAFLTNLNRIEVGAFTFSAMIKMSGKYHFLADFNILPNLRSVNIDLSTVGVGSFAFRRVTKKGNRMDLGLLGLFVESYYYNRLNELIYERYILPAPYVGIVFKLL